MKQVNEWIAGILILAILLPSPAFAAEPPSDYLLQMARVDFYLRKQQFTQAAEELGRVPKDRQSEPLFQKYAEKVMAELYGPLTKKAPAAAAPGAPQDYILNQLRVTRRKKDADERADKTTDERGWQVNEHLESDVEGKDGIRAKFVADIDGYQDGHNDLRYRTLLADFYEGPAHFAIGDTATYTTPFFLRASRFRGLHLLLPGENNEFQAVFGAYPVWLESRDEYIYPRRVWGLRDRVNLDDGRFKFGAGLVQTRDNDKIRTEDGANPQARVDPVFNARDNIVVSLDQEFKLIPEVWYVKAAQAYSNTDDRLDEDRFGETTKLKDTSFRAESLFIHPAFRSNSTFERTGPDFRLLTDLPQGAVNSPKDIRADIMRITEALDFRPFGPFDLDVEGSWVRNNLDGDNMVEMTRQSWYTADLGIGVPRDWPKPRVRGTWFHTISSPGTSSRPAQTRTLDLRGELSHQYEGLYGSLFTEYEGEYPQEDKHRQAAQDPQVFSAEEKWGFGGRLSTTFLERILVSPHYTYRISDEDFDVNTVDQQITEVRERGQSHEAGLSTSTRLWSTSSVGLSYTFFHGRWGDRIGTRLTSTENAHMGTASFSWPFSHYTWNKKKRLSVFPSVNYHLTELTHDRELRQLWTARLTAGYEVFDQWKVELMGEYLENDERKLPDLRTEESRIWLLWSTKWK